MKSDIDIIKETKFDFIQVMIGRGVQYETCGKISAAINDVVDSLAAPASGSAPTVAFPKARNLGLPGVSGYTASDVQAYGDARAAAASGAAVGGELPPLPWQTKENRGDLAAWLEARSDTEIADEFSEYGQECYLQAAIAAQAPKAALTDEQIEALVPWQGDPKDPFFDRIKFARKIEAASGPNPKLVAALQSLLNVWTKDGHAKGFGDRFEAAEEQARAALAAAGVEAEK